ncbi:MAG: DUF6680 family protein [Candidatus Omnitrophota bacterium]
MYINDVLMISAVLVAPFFAVCAQRQIDLIREKRVQKLWVFRTLMGTRGNKVSLEHVQALNSIELFFNDEREYKPILDKWNEYLDHLTTQGPPANNPDFKTELISWGIKADDLLAELLLAMGKSLGFNFDKVKIKRGIYSPVAHGDENNDKQTIRKGFAEILRGKACLPIKIIP